MVVAAAAQLAANPTPYHPSHFPTSENSSNIALVIGSSANNIIISTATTTKFKSATGDTPYYFDRMDRAANGTI
jgi:hypothetical protein